MGLLELDAWTAPANWLYVLTSALAVFFLVDHLNTLRKRKGLPGPAFAWPVIGAIVEMVLDPTNFWNRQEDYGPLSWNAIAGKFMVFSRDTDSSIKIFKSNSPEELKIVLHPNAVRLLGEDNIAFMQGAAHKELRKRLLPLFTKKALGVYLDIQIKTIREHLARVRPPFHPPSSIFPPARPSLARSLPPRRWECAAAFSIFMRHNFSFGHGSVFFLSKFGKHSGNFRKLFLVSKIFLSGVVG